MPTLVVVPLTSKLAAARFAYTVEFAPSQETGLRVLSLGLVFQITAVDRARIEEQLGTLSEEDLLRLLDCVKQMITPQEPLPE